MREYYHEYLKRIIAFVGADFVLTNAIGNMLDIQLELEKILKKAKPKQRLLIIYYNHLWEPILKLASAFGLRSNVGEQNWLDIEDINNFLKLSGWETILGKTGFFSLVTWVVARPAKQIIKDYSVTIVIPARNEAGNIAKIIKSIPKFGKSQEIIFVEGHSTDDTYNEIARQTTNRRSQIPIKLFRQRGKGKGDAVRLGFSKATGEVLMILDADMTVDPKDLPKFYNVLASGMGDFANGCRLVYPMEKDAMQDLNKIGNKIFGILFTWILGQRFKDTLCGTKVLFSKDYQKIVKSRKYFGDFDPFGDFDLIFGAIKQNLKVVEVPIRYKERIYGSTNINRFRHGLLLIKMTLFAAWKFLI